MTPTQSNWGVTPTMQWRGSSYSSSLSTATHPEQTFQMVELEVKSNHGHPEYTCLYRFRVHGKKAK